MTVALLIVMVFVVVSWLAWMSLTAPPQDRRWIQIGMVAISFTCIVMWIIAHLNWTP